MREIRFEVQDEWTPEVLFRIFEELRDNLDTGLIRNMEKYVSGWTVMKEDDTIKVIHRKAEKIESETQLVSAVVAFYKRTGVITITLMATS